MGQCHGTTKAGDRCKRTASADSLYCAAHADQDPGFNADSEAPDIDGRHGKECEPVDALLVAAALGAAAIVVVAVGKLFRL